MLKHLVWIALLVAATRSGAAECEKVFNPSPAIRQALVDELAEHAPLHGVTLYERYLESTVSRHSLTSEEWFAYAKAVSARGSTYGLEDERLSLAQYQDLLLSFPSIDALVDYVLDRPRPPEQFLALPEEVRLELLVRSAKVFFPPTYTVEAMALSDSLRLQWLKHVTLHHPDQALSALRYWKLPPAEAAKLRAFALTAKAAPELHLKSVAQVESYSIIWDRASIVGVKIQDLNQAQLKNVLAERGEAEFARIAGDQVQDRYVMIQLIQELYRLRMLQPGRPVSSSWELLQAATGISGLHLLPIARLSSNRVRQLYEVLLDIQRNFLVPVFEGVAFDPRFFTGNKSGVEELVSFLLVFRDLMNLKVSHRGSAFKGLASDRAVLLQDLEGVFLQKTTEPLQKRFVGQIKEMLHGHDYDFAFEEFARLEKKWGNLEPVFTLLSRFNGREEWKPEIPVLTKVFNAELKNQFSTYKFEGDPNDVRDQAHARRQLSMLNEVQKAAWIKPRTKAQWMGGPQAKEGILLSVLSSDAKFLLTIGDLVGTETCQNYKTGERIHALLGYVIEANVQAMASFAIQADRFLPQDWKWIRENLMAGRLKTSFNGNLLQLTVEGEGGQSATVQLGKAHLRRMLKLGQTGSSPGLRFELGFSQPHPWLDEMWDSQWALLRELGSEMHADLSLSSDLHVVGPRNPGGVYSNLGGWDVTTDYVMPKK